jgi:membrane associated rhomboid family serine protease
MNKKGNGSDHDHNTGSVPESDKLLRFPTPAERAEMRKQKEKPAENPKNKAPATQNTPFFKTHHAAGAQSPPFMNVSKIPPFTRYTVLAFIVLHAVIHLFLNEAAQAQVLFTLGFVPGHFTSMTGEFPFLAVLSPVTYQFLHGGWLHVLINVISMLVMGMFFEKEFGSRMTALFFFVCGLAGAAFHFILDPFSTQTLIGASASISGLMGAVIILLFQRNNMALRRIQKHGPWPIVIFWVIFMAGMGLMSGDSIAWQAHVGGFLAGIGLLHLIQRNKIRF